MSVGPEQQEQSLQKTRLEEEKEKECENPQQTTDEKQPAKVGNSNAAHDTKQEILEQDSIEVKQEPKEEEEKEERPVVTLKREIEETTIVNGDSLDQNEEPSTKKIKLEESNGSSIVATIPKEQRIVVTPPKNHNYFISL